MESIIKDHSDECMLALRLLSVLYCLDSLTSEVVPPTVRMGVLTPDNTGQARGHIPHRSSLSS